MGVYETNIAIGFWHVNITQLICASYRESVGDGALDVPNITVYDN